MSEGKGTWKSRKQQIRDQLYARLKTSDSPGVPETTADSPGPAATPAVTHLDPSAWGVDPESPSSATPAPATATPATPVASSGSTMPADTTKSSSEPSMAWMVAPIGFVEHSLTMSIVDPSGSLVPGLSSRAVASLQALATARHEPVEAIVLQICEFFVEAEDERAEGPLKDAIEFYCEHYTHPTLLAGV